MNWRLNLPQHGYVRPLLVTFLLLLFLTGCGKDPQKQILRDLYVETSYEEEDVWVDLVSTIFLGNLSISALELPILDPKKPDQHYGRIAFNSVLGEGSNEVTLSLNLSKVAQLGASGDPTLPNGSQLPIGGIDRDEIIELEIDEIKTKIYLMLNRSTVIVGFASVIREFDVLGDYLGGTNIFFGFNIKGVYGSVGFFTDQEELQSGLGMFFDLSAVISPEVLIEKFNPQENSSLGASSLGTMNMPMVSRNFSRSKKKGKVLVSKRLKKKEHKAFYKSFKVIKRRYGDLNLE